MKKEGMSIWGNARVRSFAIKIAAGSRVDISGTLFVFKTIINRINIDDIEKDESEITA